MTNRLHKLENLNEKLFKVFPLLFFLHKLENLNEKLFKVIQS